jgi:hypothetical protein
VEKTMGELQEQVESSTVELELNSKMVQISKD